MPDAKRPETLRDHHMIKHVAVLAAATAMALPFASCYAGSGDVDRQGTSTGTAPMSADQLFEFYKKNKDFGKKRIGLDYRKYVEGDWVVFRGEYYDKASGKPIKGAYVVFTVNGLSYPSVTNEDGVFNLELKKVDLKPGGYRIRESIDHYAFLFPDMDAEKIKKDSVYHYRIDKVRQGDGFVLSYSPIHNDPFSGNRPNFEYQERVESVPSLLGIQGVSLLVLTFILATFGGYKYFTYRLDESDREARKYMFEKRSG